MQAIAEYFRDLAAEDRYFGAVPPQPEPEMLARIAEREIARRVEAHSEDGTIVLRAEDADNAEAATGPVAEPPRTDPPAAEAGPDANATAVSALAAAPLAAAPVIAAASARDAAADARAEEQADTPAETIVADTAPETAPEADLTQALDAHTPEHAAHDEIADASGTDTLIAAALSGSDAPAEEPAFADEPAMEPVASFEDASVEDASVEDASYEDDAPEADPAEIAAAPVLDTVPDDVADDAEVAAFMQSAAPSETESYEDGDAIGTAAGTSSIADKLQRIRAVVDRTAEQDAEDEDDAEYARDEHAQPAYQPGEPMAEDTGIEEDSGPEAEIAALIAATAEDHAADPVAPQDETADLVDREALDTARAPQTIEPEVAEAEAPELMDMIGALTRDADTPDPAAPLEETGMDAASDDADFAEFDSEFETDDPVFSEPELQAEADPVEAGDIVADLDADDDTLLNDALLAEFDTAMADDESAPLEDAAQDAPDAEPEFPRRARVIKVKRRDLDATLEAQSNQGSALSPEDEDELAAELAMLDADIAGSLDSDGEDDTAQPEVQPEDQPAEAEARDAGRVLTEIGEDDGNALDRLMAEADQQMEEPESTSRRAAFDHLRAAVAATKADDKLSAEAKNTDDGAYRSDLEAAVRPRRPAATGDSSRSRPSQTTRPAPLKLVAEQRIDVDDAAPSAPIRPRRVSTTPDPMEAAAEPGDSFADYAESCGAHALPDLLEAAASYLSFVEGREQFSRPQLMTKVRQVSAGDFSREEGLRHFGSLLRSGKIEKLRGGRFTVSEDIGFQPEDGAREAG